MEKLKIISSQKGNDTITRTIRISGDSFDKINELAKKITLVSIMLLIKLLNMV